jgi:uncharacterized protein (DUF1684 family)
VIDYYDRQGRPMTTEQWCERLADESYKRIAETTLFDGTWISTVWLGLDHGFGDGPPLIFETMVFPKLGPPVTITELIADPRAGDHWIEQEGHRYPTEAAALAGHDQIVAKITEALERLREATSHLGADGGVPPPPV